MVGMGPSRLLVALVALTAALPVATADGAPDVPPPDVPPADPPTQPDPPQVRDDMHELREHLRDFLDDHPAPEAPPAPEPDVDGAVSTAEETADQAVDYMLYLRGVAREQAAQAIEFLRLGDIGQAANDVQDQAEGLLEPEPAPADESRIETEQFGAAAPVIPQNMLMAGTLVVAGTAAAVLVGIWLAGSSSVAGGAGSAGAKAAFDMRRLLPIASPLFTRFEKGTVLGHPKREALYALILQEPGISLQVLGERLNLSRTAVTHHLRLLEHQHLIVSRRVGRGRHYYENGGRYGHDQKEAYALLRNDRSRAVATFIRDRPGAIQREVCEGLGLGASIAHWHVERLREAGLVEAVRRGRTVAYYPGTAMQECLNPKVTAMAADQPAREPATPSPAVAGPRPVAALFAAAALPQ